MVCMLKCLEGSVPLHLILKWIWDKANTVKCYRIQAVSIWVLPVKFLQL